VNIPSEVKIGPYTYEIKTYDEINYDETNNEEKWLYGQAVYCDQLIKLATSYGDTRLRITLIHEVLHALDEVLCTGLEETQICRLAVGLYSLLTENTQFTDALK